MNPFQLRRRPRRQIAHGTATPHRAAIESLEPRRLMSVNVTMWHNDPGRTSLNASEQSLAPANVNSASFGKLFSYPVTGQIYAQPLYVSNLAIPGQGTHNVVFVTTMNNDVYAFDADSNSGPTAGLLWHVNLGPAAAVPSPFIGFRYGPDHDTTPLVGITSTPVIDLPSGTIFIDAFTNDVPGQDAYSHHIHALDITTGQERVSPKLVAAAVHGNGVGGDGTTVPFAANRQIQRAALTMFDGVLYAAYAAYADTDPYHGWILGFDPATLQLVSVLNTTPNLDTDANEGEGGIWQSGAGLTSDGTHLYVETGNGDFNPAVGDYGDSVLQITPDNSTPTSPHLTGWGLVVSDYFTPYNEQALADADADLGAAGAMSLPDQPGAHPHELIAVGKQGIIYVIDRDNMGTHTTTTDRVIQTVNIGHGVWGNAAYFNSSIYFHAVGDVLKRYSLTSGLLSAAPAAQSNVTYPTWPGATPAVSSNGTANGIVWDVQFETTHQVLHAYDATTLSELYNSNQDAARDQMGAGVKFITPTIADGHVFVGDSGALYVYGLIQPVTTPPAAPSDPNATAVPGAVQLTWVDNSDTESGFKIERSTDNVTFTQIALVGVDTRTYTDTAVSPTTTYYYRVRATNAIGDSDYTTSAAVTTRPPTGAINLYHFDVATGTTAVDSASANDATLTGSPLPQWVSPGQTGPSALSFSGDGVYNSPTGQSSLSLPSDLSPVLGSTSTLAFWVQTTQRGNAAHYLSPAITGVEQANGNNDINWGTLDPTGHIGLYVGDSGGVYSTSPVNDGHWHHVAMTRDAVTGQVRVYIDGLLNASNLLDAGDKTSPFSTIGALTVADTDGVTRTGATYFNGRLDELRIYNVALTPGEIAALAAPPAAPTLSSATVAAGPVVHLAFSNSSTFAENLRVERKVGVDGAFSLLATLPGGATTYDDTAVSAGVTYYYRLVATDTAGPSAPSDVIGVTPPIPTIIGVHTFYNGSSFDGQNGSSNVTDRNAIATDKQPLLPGHTATFQNYTTYSRGLNGILIDVADMSVLPRLDDFEFFVGNNSDPSTWTQAPTPAYINTYPGRGPDGSTQITIIWPDNAIQNQWLQVKVLAQPHLNLAADYTFYFGNAIGDTGDSPADAATTSADASRASTSQTSSAAVTNPYDINRDRVVDATDVALINSHLTTPATSLQLISLGSAPTIATPASASPSPVTGTTTTLSALGASTAGESNLTYTWSLIGTPPAPVAFSANNTNSAKNTTATFSAAGTYTFQVTITDPTQGTATSTVTLLVSQTATTLSAAGPTSLPVNTSAPYIATELDQFGNPMAVQPTFSWSATTGTITPAGLLTTPRTPGPITLTLSAGPLSTTLAITAYDDVLTWYRADQSAGPTLTDSSDNDQPATLTGAYSFSPGVGGNALTLAGGYATLPAGVVSSLNDFTIAAWVKVTDLQNWTRVFDFGSGTNVYMFLTPSAGGTNATRFAITTAGNGNEQQLNGPALAADTWTHLAVTLSGNTATLYVNGVAVDTNPDMTLHPTNLGQTTQDYLGKSQWPDPALQGTIDDFRLYSRALTSQQIAGLAQVLTVPTPASAPTSEITTTSTPLTVLAADANNPESALTYTWSATGPAPVTFSANSTNAAKSTTATFSAAGTYTFLVTITNPAGLSTTSTTTVLVTQTAAGYKVTPAATTVETGMTVPLQFGPVDQFGDPFGPALASVTWSLTSGTGAISPSGVYTAPNTATSATITASAPGYSPSSATLTVVNTKTAWYQANSPNGSNTLTDSSGQNRNGTVTGSHSFTAGVAGNALNLTGGVATLPDAIMAGVNDFTIATWVKITNLQNWARIFDFGSGTNSWMFLTPSAAGINALRFSIKTSGNAAQDLNGPALTPDVWTHVAVTLSGDLATLYVNGVPVGTNPNMTFHPAALGNTTADFIGDSQFPADPTLQGSVDDFRIYNRALPAAQVAQLALPTIVNAAAASPDPVTSTTTNLTALAADVTTGESALTYTWSATGPAAVTFSANATNAAKNTTATFSAAGAYTFTVTATDPTGFSATSTTTVTVQSVAQSLAITPATQLVDAAGSQQFTATVTNQFGSPIAQPSVTWSLASGTGTVDPSGLYTAPASPGATAVVRAASGSLIATANVTVVTPDKSLAWYHFDETSGTNASDASGQNNTSTLAGPASFSPGITGNALTLTGGYASLPAGVVRPLAADFTIATWVRLTSLPIWSRIFDFGTGTNVYMFLTPAAGPTGKPRFAVTTGGIGGEQIVDSSTSLTPNTWAHLAVVLSGNTATLYLNGTPVGTNTDVTLRPSSLGTTTANYIGKSQFAADPALPGRVEEFHIFGRALTPAEIQALAGGALTGTAYHDANDDNTRNPGEPALPDATLYLDANDNAQLDPGEPTATSDAAGNYTFPYAAPATYTLRELTAPAGFFAPTSPVVTISAATLTTADLPHVQTAYAGTPGDDTYTLRRNATTGRYELLSGTTLVASLPPTTPSLSLALGAGSDTLTLDLTNGSPLPPGGLSTDADTITVPYAGPTPVTTIRQALASGQLANPTATSPFQRLGYIDTGSSIQLELTTAGDANLNGRIDADDYALMDVGRLRGSSTWTFGDFNYDGLVNDADATLLNEAAAAAAGAAATSLTAPVPPANDATDPGATATTAPTVPSPETTPTASAPTSPSSSSSPSTTTNPSAPPLSPPVPTAAHPTSPPKKAPAKPSRKPPVAAPHKPAAKPKAAAHRRARKTAKTRATTKPPKPLSSQPITVRRHANVRSIIAALWNMRLR